MKLCLNRNVLIGLAAVGLSIWILAPNLLAAALPLLLLAACPLSMLVMMRGMQGGQCTTASSPQSPPRPVRLTEQEQLTELKAQLAILQTRQQAIGREIAELEAASTPALRQAEAIASAAEERVQRQL